MTDLMQRELILSAPPEDVWRAVTDPSWLEAWLADRVSLELWPGGDARFTIGDQERSGWIEEVSPPPVEGPAGTTGRLAFWWARPEEPASRVELALISTGDGTLLRVTETRPLEILDLVGIPLSGHGGAGYGPALVAA
jgi:uncharacterized protein YndB with AHSA1/START domain